MASLSTVDVTVGLIVLFGALLPEGAVLIRVGERWIGRRLRLFPAERLLLAFFVAGAEFFVIASLPIPGYSQPVVGTVLIVGTILYAWFTFRERGRNLRAVLSWVGSPAGALIAAGTLGLLVIEVSSVASFGFGNAWDASFASLNVNLLVNQHMIPWTTTPYAANGVTYPFGSVVWESLPVLLFGWPVVSIPVVLPPLFLSLSPLAAFCLGQRLTDPEKAAAIPAGLLFAAFFGLVLSWPRLFVGGSYDFAFALPLFMVILGWLRPFVANPRRSWKEVVLLGAAIGISASLSASIGLALLALLLGFILLFHPRSPGALSGWLARFASIGALTAAFLIRSLVGIAVWFDYPGHVLTATGRPPYAPFAFPDLASLATFNGELNPFVLWKPKVSPIAFQSVEISVLIGAGLLLAVLMIVRPSDRLAKYLPRRTVESVVATTMILLLLTAGVVLSGATSRAISGVQSVTSDEEMSFLLFLAYELLAMLPILAAFNFAMGSRRKAPEARGAADPGRETPSAASHHRARAPSRGRGWAVLAGLVVVVPLTLGMGTTVLIVPDYVNDHLAQFANTTAGDVSALEWVGEHLPICSNVVVAPGAVGQFLPEYALVHLVFPSFPQSVNLSYYVVVSNLTAGSYTAETRTALLDLDATDVFVSGQTSVSFPPFLLAPLLGSSDFSELAHFQDAYVFGFLPGLTTTGCPAVN